MNSGNMTVTFRLRLSASELDRWRQGAWEGRQSVSELVRSAVAAELKRRRRLAQLEAEREAEAELDPFERVAQLHRLIGG